jgi:hypothetical protein
MAQLRKIAPCESCGEPLKRVRRKDAAGDSYDCANHCWCCAICGVEMRED